MSKQEKIQEIWEKALKIAKNDENLAEKLYPVLIRELKAKQKIKAIKSKERAKQRKRRTRALILFATWVLKKAKQGNLSARDLLKKLEYEKEALKGKEGRTEIDYYPYLKKEIERLQIQTNQKPKIKITPFKK